MTGYENSAHEELIADYDDLWHGDFSKLDTVAQSVVVREPGIPGGELRGRDALEERIREVRSGFPDLHIEIEDVLVDEGVVMTEWTMTGTHEGDYLGIPPTDRAIDVSGMSSIRIADGKVQEDRMYFDRRALFEQLGLTDDGG